jgi:Ras homolog gene family, member A
MECSSKENIGVEEIFDTAITTAVKAGEEAASDNRLNARDDSSRGGSGLSGNSSEKRRRKKNKGCKFL